MTPARLIAKIAAQLLDDEGPDGDFVLENDDAWELVHNWVEQARSIEAEVLVAAASHRPCLDAETTDAELAQWCRTVIIPAMERRQLL